MLNGQLTDSVNAVNDNSQYETEKKQHSFNGQLASEM